MPPLLQPWQHLRHRHLPYSPPHPVTSLGTGVAPKTRPLIGKVPGPNPQTAAAAPTPPILVHQGVTVVNPGAKTGGDRAQEMTGQGPKEEEEEDEDNATSGITPTPGPTHPAETNPRVEDNQPRTGSAGKLTSGEMRHSPRPQPLQDKVSTIKIILKTLVL